MGNTFVNSGIKQGDKFYALEEMSRRPHGHSKLLSEDEIFRGIKLKLRFPIHGPKLSLTEYSATLNEFRFENNEQRPHEAIDMMFPAELYKISKTPYHKPSKDIIYPIELLIRKVNKQSEIKYQGNVFTISGTFKLKVLPMF